MKDTQEVFRGLLEDIMKTDLRGYKVRIPASSESALKQGDVAYVSFFDSKDKWQGNLKKFRLDGATVVNKHHQPVFNTDGTIDEEAVKFDLWSDASDDWPIHSGGVSGQFNHLTTDRYVWSTVGNLHIMNPMTGTITGLNLTLSDFNVATGDPLDLIKLTAGVDIRDDDSDGDDTDTFTRFGDALRSEPVKFIYRRDTANPSNNIEKVFIANNFGYIHSFDDGTGAEDWAVIAQTFLPNIGAFFMTDPTKQYGFDGGLELLHLDLNGDFDLLNGTALDQDANGVNEKLYLYAASRRGGSLIAALDISNPNTPQPAWQIDNSLTDYAHLGQSWSKPKAGFIQLGPMSEGTNKPVLFVGGGYDDKYDDPLMSIPSQIGSGIYMIDAQTGSKLWAAGKDGENIPHMKYPIVNEVKTLDVDSDGVIDLFYALDIMGQIFRCDIDDLPDSVANSAIPGNGEIDCRRIATLDSTYKRRFYNGLDAVLVINNLGAITYVALSTGSGNINTPDAATSASAGNLDRFYAVFDESPLAKPANPSDYLDTDESQLENATSGAVDGIATNKDSNNKDGWYIELDPGEKIMSSPSTFFFMSSFQTYYPDNTSGPTNTCTIKPSYSGRSFLLDVRNASKVKDLGGSDPRATEIDVVTGLTDVGTARIERIGKNIKVSVSNGGGDPVELPLLPATLMSNYSDEEYVKNP